jgi:RNA polymerase sigma factor (sigma-70 family)
MDRPVTFPDLAARLRVGDEEAATEIVRHFARRLAALARRHLHVVVRPRVDPEDVVQSVFGSFFRRRPTAFDLDGWDSLWHLLACITVRKCARKAGRAMRELADETALAATIDRRPTPEEAATWHDVFEQLTHDLSEREREIFALRLQGFSSSEVSTYLGCTERKVQRLMEHLRARLLRLQAT